MPGSQYAWPHQKARRKAIASLVEGTRCWRCGRPMFRWQDLDLDHVVPVVLGGTDSGTVLAHARCNRSAGATLGNRLRGRRRGRRRRALPKW